MTYRTFDGTSQEETIVDGRFSSSGDIALADGTATQGAIYFADDKNTGIYSPSNDSIAFSTAGTDALTLASNVELYYDGSPKIKTRSDGVGISSDTDALFFGEHDDLKIYQNNGNSVIKSQTGVLYLQSNSHIDIKTTGGSNKQAIFCNIHGAVDLYHNGNGPKLSTTTEGAKVTGDFAANNISGRNLIVNGAMKIAQRATTSTASGIHTIDRFKHAPGGNENDITFSQANVASGTPAYKAGFRKCLKVLNGDQTQANADHLELSTTLEAQDIANSGWEYTSPSSYMTFSCWIKSSVAQAFSGSFRNIDGTVKAFKFTTPSLSIDTWTKFTVLIPGHADLSFDDNTEQGFKIYLYPYIGPTYTTAASDTETWVAGTNENYANDMASTWWTTNTSTFEMTGWQLEVGKLATPFEHKSYGETLIDCHRYFYKMTIHSSQGPTALQYRNTHKMSVVQFPTIMRATPTCTATWSTAGTFTHYHNSVDHFKAYVSSNYDAADSYYLTTFTADSEL